MNFRDNVVVITGGSTCIAPADHSRGKVRRDTEFSQFLTL